MVLDGDVHTRPSQVVDVFHRPRSATLRAEHSDIYLTYYTANAVQVMDWRMPMHAGQHQVYADALFGAAADALLAPPIQDES